MPSNTSLCMSPQEAQVSSKQQPAEVGSKFPMEEDDFLYYEKQDDLSHASSDMTDDSEGEEDSDSDEDDSDDDSSIGSVGDEAFIEDLKSCMSGNRGGVRRTNSSVSLKSFASMGSIGSIASLGPGTPAETVVQRMIENSQRKTLAHASSSRDLMEEGKKRGSIKAEDQGKVNGLRPSSSMADLMSKGMTLTQNVSAQALPEGEDDGAIKPDEHLKNILGYTPQIFTYNDLEGYFLESKPEYVQAWTNELTKAVRDHDLKTLQNMHQKGQLLQACNQFGESIIHLCVRRGTPEILRFLVQDAGVCVRVCCDYGRTPLHDAAWNLASDVKSYQKMMILLVESPIQLFITDKRGFTPLSYVPRARWAECNAFLDKQYAKGRLAALEMERSNVQ